MSPLVILSAEDNYGDQRLMELAFRSDASGTNLRVVTNGDELIAYLRNEGEYASAPPPDLILLDLNLPKMSGREVLIQVRNNARFRDVPIVVFTGAQPSPQMKALCEMGSCFYVVKPDGIEPFFAVMEAVRDYARAVRDFPAQRHFHERRFRALVAA